MAQARDVGFIWEYRVFHASIADWSSAPRRPMASIWARKVPVVSRSMATTSGHSVVEDLVACSSTGSSASARLTTPMKSYIAAIPLIV